MQLADARRANGKLLSISFSLGESEVFHLCLWWIDFLEERSLRNSGLRVDLCNHGAALEPESPDAKAAVESHLHHGRVAFGAGAGGSNFRDRPDVAPLEGLGWW